MHPLIMLLIQSFAPRVPRSSVLSHQLFHFHFLGDPQRNWPSPPRQKPVRALIKTSAVFLLPTSTWGDGQSYSARISIHTHSHTRHWSVCWGFHLGGRNCWRHWRCCPQNMNKHFSKHTHLWILLKLWATRHTGLKLSARKNIKSNMSCDL